MASSINLYMYIYYSEVWTIPHLCSLNLLTVPNTETLYNSGLYSIFLLSKPTSFLYAFNNIIKFVNDINVPVRPTPALQ